jgi:integrase
VRGPRHVVRRGKTPVLDPAEARQLIDAIDTTTVIGLRDRALIGLMVYSFAHIGAAIGMRVEDVFTQNRRLCVRLHEKGGKQHAMPCHHNLESYLHEYIDGAAFHGGEFPSAALSLRRHGGRRYRCWCRPSKTTDTARIATSAAISRRRESMTSAKAPEGRVNRNNGRLTTTCTRDTVIGLASRLVINQPDAVSNIAVPTFETRLVVHITVKARRLNGPHRERAGAVGAAAVVRSALKQISLRLTRAPPEATCQSTA